MIHYRLGGRYYYEQEGDEYALNEREWEHLMKAKTSALFYTESGMKIVIRKQNKTDKDK